MRRLAMPAIIAFLVAGILLPLQAGALSLQDPSPSPDSVTVPKTFHIAGVPGLKRDARVDLTLTADALILTQGKKTRLTIPFERIRRVTQLYGEREYPKTAYVATVATFGVGSLLLLKKRKMDTLVVDFSNERGGLMGAVLQLPQGQGDSCKEWLFRHNVRVEDFEPAAEAN